MPIQQKWIRLIPFKPTKDYSELKNEAIKNEIPVATEEVIILDIKRSFHIHSQVLNQNTLYLLLKTYAYFHPEIAYCQGTSRLTKVWTISRDTSTSRRLMSTIPMSFLSIWWRWGSRRSSFRSLKCWGLRCTSSKDCLTYFIQTLASISRDRPSLPPVISSPG